MSGGCHWAPFQIDEHEYERLVVALKQPGPTRGRGVQTSEAAPGHIQSKNALHAWTHHIEGGAPFEEALALIEREQELQIKVQEAVGRGDENAVQAIHMQWYEAATELQEFLDVCSAQVKRLD